MVQCDGWLPKHNQNQNWNGAVAGGQAEHLARLACCSRDVQVVAASNDLWRPLFQAEFGEAYLAESVAGPRGWQV